MAYTALCVLENQNIDEDKIQDIIIKAQFVLEKLQIASLKKDSVIKYFMLYIDGNEKAITEM